METKGSSKNIDLLKSLGAPVAVVGSINADLTVETERLPEPGETVVGGPLAILPGGKSANQAVTCALLGADVNLIGAVGLDGHGDLLLASLQKAGVNTLGIRRVEQPSGSTLITVDKAGENTIVYSAGANNAVDAKMVHSKRRLIREANVLGLCLEAPIEAVQEAARIAHKAGKTVVLNYSPIVKVPDSLLEQVDVLIVNEHELAVLSGRKLDAESSEDLEKAMRELDCDRVVLTLGANGSKVLEDGEIFDVPAVRVETVDTTGAGDSFMGTLLCPLSAGHSLVDGAKLAAGVSALATKKVGAQASYRNADEVKEFLKAQA